MLTSLISLFTGNAARQVGGRLLEAYEVKMKAESDEKKLEADILITQLEAQRDIVLAEQKRSLTAWIRPMVALPVVILLWKILVWDMTLGLGITPEPGVFVTTIVGTVLGAYFVTRPFGSK